MHAILEALSFLFDLILSPSEWKKHRARRRQQMEDLDLRKPKEWESLV
jgi:hypothetical protein